MNIKRSISTFKVFSLSFSIAFLIFNFRKSFFENTDTYINGLFGTKHSYLNWIGESREAESIYDLYIISFNFLIAPEPLNAIIGFSLSNIFDNNFVALDAITFFTLFTITFYALSSTVPLYVKLLATLGLAIGFYEYILLFDIYRFQLSFIFFMWGNYLPSNSRKQIFFIYLSTLCHLSILLILPILFLLGKGLGAKNSFSFNTLLIVITLSFFSYLILLVPLGTEFLDRLVAKAHGLAPYLIYILPILFLLVFLQNIRIRSPSLLYLFSLAVYCSFILFYFGSSRILMLLYLTALIFFLNQKYIFKSLSSFVLFFLYILLMIHNFLRSFTLLNWSLS